MVWAWNVIMGYAKKLKMTGRGRASTDHPKWTCDVKECTSSQSITFFLFFPLFLIVHLAFFLR
jgi:hypothetical protein